MDVQKGRQRDVVGTLLGLHLLKGRPADLGRPKLDYGILICL